LTLSIVLFSATQLRNPIPTGTKGKKEPSFVTKMSSERVVEDSVMSEGFLGAALPFMFGCMFVELLVSYLKGKKFYRVDDTINRCAQSNSQHSKSRPVVSKRDLFPGESDLV
jgi:hypothetical protein